MLESFRCVFSLKSSDVRHSIYYKLLTMIIIINLYIPAIRALNYLPQPFKEENYYQMIDSRYRQTFHFFLYIQYLELMIFAANICKNQILKLSSEKEGTLIIKNISIDPQSQQAFVYLKVPHCSETTLIVKLNQLNQCAYHTMIQLPLHKKSQEQIISLHGKVHIIGNYVLKEEDASIKHIKNVLNIDKYSYQLQIKQDNDQIEQLKAQSRMSRSRISRRSRQNVKPDKVSIEKSQKDNKKRQHKQKSLLQMLKEVGSDEQEDQDDSYEQEQEEEDQESSEQQQIQAKIDKGITQKPIKREVKKAKQEQKNKKPAKALNWASALSNLQDDDQQDEDQNYQESSQQEQSDQQSDDQSFQADKFIQQKKQKDSKEEKVQKKERKHKEVQEIKQILKVKQFQYVKPSKIPEFIFKN